MTLLQTLGLRLPGTSLSPSLSPSITSTRPTATAVPVEESTRAALPEPGQPGVRLGRGRERSNATIAPPLAVPPVQVQAGDKAISVTKRPNGRVQYTAPPPKVGEITFSGGGGKGTALPGAVKALHESGVLAGATKIAGASVGSMTAALVAAGITSDEMLAVADADSTTDSITEGTGGSKAGLLARALKNKVTGKGGSPLTGQGLEDAVRGVLDETLRKRIVEYGNACANADKKPDPAVSAVAERLAKAKNGPTFGDYRALAQAIPAIKEVVMTGTYTTEKSGGKKLKGGNDEGQLYVFDADSEPDLPVAVAVHASASFPGAFKPIDIKLASGLTVTFIDGGVMNNTPTSSSIGNERELDPMPQQRGVTFVFEDDAGDADSILKGKVNPAQGTLARIADWFVGSANAGAEYAKNKSMADKPGEVVVVPLQIELPPKKKGGKGEKYDMRGTAKGTLNFSPPKPVRDGLRAMTEEATKQQIAADAKPRTREFASDAQLFVSIPLDELEALAKSGYEGAKAALAFRERVAAIVPLLQAGAKKATAAKGGRPADALKDPAVSAALAELDTLAGAETEFQVYVGRELNKKADLDSMLEAARRAPRGSGKPSPTMAATDAVAEGLRARTFSDNILKQLVYPKMKQEPKGGAGILTLLTLEQLLRTAKAPADVNQAIDMGVAHFRGKPDHRIPKRGHQRFARQLDQRRMRAAR